jgi:hypothetical protein
MIFLLSAKIQEGVILDRRDFIAAILVAALGCCVCIGRVLRAPQTCMLNRMIPVVLLFIT